jgi:hypothetical protein
MSLPSAGVVGRVGQIISGSVRIGSGAMMYNHPRRCPQWTWVVSVRVTWGLIW